MSETKRPRSEGKRSKSESKKSKAAGRPKSKGGETKRRKKDTPAADPATAAPAASSGEVPVTYTDFNTLRDRIQAGRRAIVRLNGTNEQVEMRDDALYVQRTGAELTPVMVIEQHP